MNSDQNKRSYELFLQALELPKDERTAFLERKTSSDTELCSFVKAMVSEDEDATQQGFLSVAPSSFRQDDRLGTAVGPYYLRDRIGEGGQGVVYLASRRDDFKQSRVALKVLKRGMDTEEVVARFRDERQRLAALNHENIARLLHGGDTPDKLPYFAMEYVEGEIITADCEKRWSAKGASAIKEILAIFQNVCGAVSYVHGFGLLHRDLKPGNILVTKDGTPKVLDFGIAKALASDLSGASHTTVDTRNRPHTPRYGSPEQVRGEAVLTVRTDVYSLGVVLYELLTGQSPYGNKESLKQLSYDELRARVLDGHIVDPSKACASTRRKWIDRDMDAICLKALELAEANRYSSVQELADDIERRFENLPIQAKARGTVYRLRKFLRRNSIAVGATSAVILSLLGGLGIAEFQRRRATAAQALAEHHFIQAWEAVDDFFIDVSENPDLLLGTPGTQELRRRLLEKARLYYETFRSERPEDLRIPDTIATSYWRLGGIYSETGDYKRAFANTQKALAIARQLSNENPTNHAMQQRHAALLRLLGSLSARLGDSAAALDLLSAAIAIQKGLVEADETMDAYRRKLSDMYETLGSFYLSHHQLDKALEICTEALKLRDELANRNRSVLVYQNELAECCVLLARVHTFLNQPDLAILALNRARSNQVTLEGGDPYAVASVSLQAGINGMLAQLYSRQSQFTTAIASYREAIVIQERLTRENHLVASYQAELADLHLGLGRAFQDSGEAESARNEFMNATRMYERLETQAPTVVAYANGLARANEELATFLERSGNLQGALVFCRRALVPQTRLVHDYPEAPRHWAGLASVQRTLGKILTKAGEFDQAVDALQSAIGAQEKAVSGILSATSYEKKRAALDAEIRSREEHEEQVLSTETHSAKEALDAIESTYDANCDLERFSLFYRSPESYYTGLVSLHLLLGTEYHNAKQFAKASESYTTLIEMLTRPVPYAEGQWFRNALEVTYTTRSAALADMGQYERALEDLDRAFGLADESIAERIRFKRIVVVARSGDHNRASADALATLGTPSQPGYGERLYDAACVFSRCSEVASLDTSLSEAERSSRAEKYASRAVEFLDRANEGGYFKDKAATARRLRADDNLTSIRDREDFRKVFAAVDEK